MLAVARAHQEHCCHDRTMWIGCKHCEVKGRVAKVAQMCFIFSKAEAVVFFTNEMHSSVVRAM